MRERPCDASIFRAANRELEYCEVVLPSSVARRQLWLALDAQCGADARMPMQHRLTR